MDRPEVVSREEWIDARRALLAEEKAPTQARDVLNEQRRGLPMGVAPVEYNYRTKAEHEQAGMPWHTRGEQPGTSVFVRDGDDLFHTYSTYARGGELLLTSFNYLDLTPSGRPYHVGEVPHHDRYGDDHPETNIGFLLAGGGAATTA